MLDALCYKLIYTNVKWMVYLSNRYDGVTHAKYSTELTKNSQGLPQRDILSAILWTIFVNHCEILEENKDHVSIGIFADDMTLIALPVEYGPIVINCLQL